MPPSAVLFLLGLVAGSGDVLPRTDPAGCQLVAAEASAPAHLKQSRSRPPVWEQIDAVLARLTPSLQGQQCSYRFRDLFTGFDDQDWVPLTNRVLALAPPSELAGLTVYGDGGRQLGLVVDQSTLDVDGALSRFGVFTALNYRTAEGDLRSTGRRLLQGDILVRWADLRDRIVVDTSGSNQDPVAAGRRR